MIRYLLDTNVLSVGAPATRTPAAMDLANWMRANGERLFVPAISIAEIVAGIAQLRRTGASTKAAALETWLVMVLGRYRRRTLSFDLRAARDAGAIMDRARAIGQSPGFADIAIAGIAMAHGLTLLTRNLRHFAPLGVPAHDPYAALPD